MAADTGGVSAARIHDVTAYFSHLVNLIPAHHYLDHEEAITLRHMKKGERASAKAAFKKQHRCATALLHRAAHEHKHDPCTRTLCSRPTAERVTNAVATVSCHMEDVLSARGCHSAVFVSTTVCCSDQTTDAERAHQDHDSLCAGKIN